jgi:hypothetical protein
MLGEKCTDLRARGETRPRAIAPWSRRTHFGTLTSHKQHGCLFSAPGYPEFVEKLSTYRRAVIDTFPRLGPMAETLAPAAQRVVPCTAKRTSPQEVI